MEDLIGVHGGYRNLKSFQIRQLVYDITVRFTERYVDRFSRTRDQMVQAARSGVQNIAEGSQISATSKKIELKLTQVARASLEELRLDYEDFLRQRELPILPPSHPILLRIKEEKPKTLREFAEWVARERKLSLADVPLSSACLAANGALSLINIACYFLDKQVIRLAEDFKKEGGFTERLYRMRSQNRRSRPPSR
ncbi:MAG: four helix bundle suffix domain-containing protein [Opitutales bacterium]|nr:four helix bundle suffix domain-containing protein [Opitutales bacterium]